MQLDRAGLGWVGVAGQAQANGGVLHGLYAPGLQVGFGVTPGRFIAYVPMRV